MRTIPACTVISTCPVASFVLTNTVPDPTPTPAERFATLLHWLGQAVVTRNNAGLSLSLIALIIKRIREIAQPVARLVAAIREGRYVPRRFARRRRPEANRPRPPNPLPKNFGWLLPLVPEAVGYRSQLEYLLRDAEVSALLATAPEALRRPLRSLCWMLRLRPPPILASPRRPPPKPATPPPAAARPQPPPRPRPAKSRPPKSRPGPAPPASARGPPSPT